MQLRGSATAVAVPLITPDGDVAFVQYRGANRQLSPAHCADPPDSDVLLLQGEVSSITAEYAARVIGGRGGIVVLNPAPAHDITGQLLAAVTVVCPDEVEAAALLGRPTSRGCQASFWMACRPRTGRPCRTAPGSRLTPRHRPVPRRRRERALLRVSP